MKLSYVPLSVFREADNLPMFDRCRAYAALNRINVLYMVKRAGSGHLGSSFSAIDIMTWLYLYGLGPDDVFFSSKGHDCPALYATLISVGRLPFELLHSLRVLGGLPGHPVAGFSPDIPFSVGSLGQGISKAKGMILANRLLGKKGRVFVMVGDGELQEGQNWEALRTAYEYPELQIIIDSNGMQSDNKTLSNPLIGLPREFNGHSFQEIDRSLSERTFSGLVEADTVKGKGVSFMEQLGDDGLYHFHSGAPSDEDYERALDELLPVAYKLVPSLTLESTVVKSFKKRPNSLIVAYSQALLEAGKDKRVVVLDADLMVDCGLKPFRDAYPDRFFECGIAEQDMVSMAGAMARQGFIPFVHSFAAFLTRRATDQIYNNCCEGDKVIYVGSLAGPLGKTGPGKSHEALFDGLTMLRMPGMKVCEPEEPVVIEFLVDFAVNKATGPVYIRLLASGGVMQ